MIEKSCARAHGAANLGEESAAPESRRIDAGDLVERRDAGVATLGRAKEDAAEPREICRIEAMMAVG